MANITALWRTWVKGETVTPAKLNTPITIDLNDVLPTGLSFDYMGSSAPTGFVLAIGGSSSNGSIGNAASGATQRANADTSSLFELLWDSSTNTDLPIEDSSGVATTRGASAAADYAANKRMPTPDYRGRASVGKDNMGGTSANIVTDANADLLFGKFGAETVTSSSSIASQAANIDVGAGASFDGFVKTTGYKGSLAVTNGATSVIQPSLAVNKIIKL